MRGNAGNLGGGTAAKPMEEVARSVSSVTGWATLPVTARRKRNAATDATVKDISPRTASRVRIPRPVITVIRLVTLRGTARSPALRTGCPAKLASIAISPVIYRGTVPRT